MPSPKMMVTKKWHFILGRLEGYFLIMSYFNSKTYRMYVVLFYVCVLYSDLNCCFRNRLNWGVVDALVFALVLFIFCSVQ